MLKEMSFHYGGLVVCITLLLWSCSCWGMKESCDTLQYEGKYGGTSRSMSRSIMVDGDFIIQGLFGISSDNCSFVRSRSLVSLMALQFAIEGLNKDNEYLPGLKIGYQVHDSCFTVPSVMSRGIEIVSLHRPGSVCRAEYLDCKDVDSGVKRTAKRVTAVVGTGMSITTIPLASLLGLYWIPHLSFAASSRLLSKKNLYRSFLRTIPSDSNQALAMLDLMKRFEWKYVFAVGSDDDYGKLGVSALKESAASRNVCIAQDEYIPYLRENTAEKAISIVNMLEKEEKAHVVVLFCYVSQGALIIREAQRRGMKRLWLTSDAWSSDTIPEDIRDALLGSFSLSTRSGYVPGFVDYVHKTVATKYHCNHWLNRFVTVEMGCKVMKYTANGFECDNGKTDKDVVKAVLSAYNGGIATMIDAIKAVAVGSHNALKSVCKNADMTTCRNWLPLSPSMITSYIFRAKFNGTHNHTVEFTREGDPVVVYYNIENFQTVNGKRQFVRVGNWENMRPVNLALETNSIVWPSKKIEPPQSACNRRCIPGEYVPAETECCWSCQECAENYVSNMSMAKKCHPCASGYHTDNAKTRCIPTPIVYLTASQPAGISIIAVSALGLAVTLFLLAIFVHYRQTPIVLESSPHMLFLSLACLIVTFTYGPLQVAKPSQAFCSGRNAFFFFIFAMYASLMLVKTNWSAVFLQKTVYRFLGLNLPSLQYFGMFVLIIVEIALIVLWLGISPVPVEKNLASGKKELWMECKVDFTTNRLIVTFFPCLILVLATIISFRERNHSHIFNEPKFASFASIAFCIIVMAFLPTFKYVVGVYRSIVMAFTIDVCGFTYIGCLMIPKLYVALFNKERNQFVVEVPERRESYNVHHVDTNGSNIATNANHHEKGVNIDKALLDQSGETVHVISSPAARSDRSEGATESDSQKDLMGVSLSTA